MDTMKRYEKFADQIAELIRSGVLAPGEKVPSVRHASRTYGVSPSTVFQAYYLLEDRGLISARARSGYFVRELAQHPLAEPETSAQAAQTTEVDVSELVFSVLGSLKDPHTVPFGSAFPSPQLFPLQRLARSMAHALRDMPAHAVIADMTAGNPDLRRQIALRYMVAGVRLPLDELVISNGALEALNLCLQTVTNPGDLVAIEAPAFYATLQVLERLKLKAVEIPVNPRDGVDLDVLGERLASLPIKACWFMSSLQALGLVDTPGLRLDAPAQLLLAPGEILDVPVTVVLLAERTGGTATPVHFEVYNLADDSERMQTASTFLAPSGR